MYICVSDCIFPCHFCSLRRAVRRSQSWFLATRILSYSDSLTLRFSDADGKEGYAVALGVELKDSCVGLQGINLSGKSANSNNRNLQTETFSPSPQRLLNVRTIGRVSAHLGREWSKGSRAALQRNAVLQSAYILWSTSVDDPLRT